MQRFKEYIQFLILLAFNICLGYGLYKLFLTLWPYL